MRPSCDVGRTTAVADKDTIYGFKKVKVRLPAGIPSMLYMGDLNVEIQG